MYVSIFVTYYRYVCTVCYGYFLMKYKIIFVYMYVCMYVFQGGQSHIDIPHRFGNHCSVPGINQYGFDEYVGMSEGSHSMRYVTHQQHNTYHTGARYLFRNDVPLPRSSFKQCLKCMYVYVCICTYVCMYVCMYVSTVVIYSPSGKYKIM